MSIEERLASLQSGNSSNQQPTGPADSLTTLLTQALQSNDTTMLNVSVTSLYYSFICYYDVGCSL